MHRLASIPGDRTEDDGALFVEQPPAPVVLLSSADTDLLAVSQLLQAEPGLLPAELRALNLSALQHPAVIDHYVATTLATTRLVLVRLLGGRGHWSYGLECLRHWASSGDGRQLLVLAGTAEEDQAMACLGSLDGPLAMACAACLREGGAANLRLLLQTLAALLAGEHPKPPRPTPAADPLPHD